MGSPSYAHFALADRMADGCFLHEATIGILQNTEATVRAAITALSNAETQTGLKKAAVSTAYTALQGADNTGLTTLTNCKLRLASVLGQRWSAAWAPCAAITRRRSARASSSPRC
jgi:hypothetical protein